jgi:hypothetical protein
VRDLKQTDMMIKRAEGLQRRRDILTLFDRQPSPSEIVTEVIRRIVAEYGANGSQPQE